MCVADPAGDLAPCCLLRWCFYCSWVGVVLAGRWGVRLLRKISMGHHSTPSHQVVILHPRDFISWHQARLTHACLGSMRPWVNGISRTLTTKMGPLRRSPVPPSLQRHPWPKMHPRPHPPNVPTPRIEPEGDPERKETETEKRAEMLVRSGSDDSMAYFAGS